MKQTLTTGEARDRFARVINQAFYASERTVITRRGERVAAIVPVADLELLYELESLFDVDEARKAMKEAKSKGTTPLAALKKELGLD